jgi:hypothetical protein
MRIFSGLVFLILGTLGSIGFAKADGSIDFVLLNNTSSKMTKMYIVLPRDRTWQRNIFDRGETLLPGEKMDIEIDDQVSDCNYDVLIAFADGEIMEDFDVDLCSWEGRVYDVSEEERSTPNSGSVLFDILFN